jgi:RNA polymerase subunit RPABC4/transcription elongation factor Spt4
MFKVQRRMCKTCIYRPDTADVHCYYCGKYMHSEWAAEVWLYHPELKPKTVDKPWCGECDTTKPRKDA